MQEREFSWANYLLRLRSVDEWLLSLVLSKWWAYFNCRDIFLTYIIFSPILCTRNFCISMNLQQAVLKMELHETIHQIRNKVFFKHLQTFFQMPTNEPNTWNELNEMLTLKIC